MSQPEPLTEQQLANWKRRALRAEAAVHHALWMRPLGPHWSGREPETADQMRLRFHQHMQDRYPDLITRSEHRRMEVFQIADDCGCPEGADDWEEFHGETSDEGQSLCSKKFLGYVCDSCEGEDGEGAVWKPYAVEWPCPPIAALDSAPAGTAAPAPPVAPLAASQPSEAPTEPGTPTRPPTPLLDRAEHYLSVLHTHQAQHDTLAAGYTCAGCELRDAIRAQQAATTDGQPQPAV